MRAINETNDSVCLGEFIQLGGWGIYVEIRPFIFIV